MEKPNKDSYDVLLGFSRITPENWLAPDRKNFMPFGISERDWINNFLEPRLDAVVPKDVIKVFEVARASMIYSWFFYPMATLGQDQCTRVAEFAVHERCVMLSQKPGNFSKNIKILSKAGLLSAEDERRWQIIRTARNNASHLKHYSLSDPGQVLNFMRIVVELINSLFRQPNPTNSK